MSQPGGVDDQRVQSTGKHNVQLLIQFQINLLQKIQLNTIPIQL